MSKAERQARARSVLDDLPAEYGSAWTIVQRLMHECVRPNWRYLVVTVVAMAVTAGTAGVLPFLLQKVADDVFVGKDSRLLYLLPVLVVLVMSLRGLSDWATSISEAWLGTKVV